MGLGMHTAKVKGLWKNSLIGMLQAIIYFSELSISPGPAFSCVILLSEGGRWVSVTSSDHLNDTIPPVLLLLQVFVGDVII